MRTATPQEAPEIADFINQSRQSWKEHNPYRVNEIEHILQTGETEMYWRDDQGLLESYHRENAKQIICMYPYRHPSAPEHVEDDLIAFAKELSNSRHIPLEISIPQSKEREIQKLVSQGYVHSRTFYRMYLQGENLQQVKSPVLPQGWAFRRVGAAEFHGMHNDAFRSHYGFAPMTLRAVENWYADPEHNPDEWQVLTVHGKAVSYFSIGKQEDGGHVYLLGTLREEQGKGYGRIALQQACALLKAQGVERIQLGVDTGNEHALNFYKRVGFEVAYANLRYRYEPRTLTL